MYSLITFVYLNLQVTITTQIVYNLIIYKYYGNCVNGNCIVMYVLKRGNKHCTSLIYVEFQ